MGERRRRGRLWALKLGDVLSVTVSAFQNLRVQPSPKALLAGSEAFFLIGFRLEGVVCKSRDYLSIWSLER